LVTVALFILVRNLKKLIMKTSIRNAALIILAIMLSQARAQLPGGNCVGSNFVISAVNSLNLSNPSYSLNPGGIISPNPTFAVAPTSLITYTLYVTGTNSNSAVVTTSSTVNVNGLTYSLASPQAYSLGCGQQSVCLVNILGASTAPIPGGQVSYSLLAPGSSSILPTGTLSNIASYPINVPGIYTVVVRDNTSLCTDRSTVNITANQTSPVIGSITVSQNTLTCSNGSISIQAIPSPSMQYNWLPFGVQSSSITIFSTVALANGAFNSVTLVVTDPSNSCLSATLIPFHKNCFKPNAIINYPISGSCQNSVIITHSSNSTIPNSIFSNSLPVVAHLWEGPSPQTTLGLSSTYTAQAIGIYTLTAMDMNNGCIKTETFQVAGFMLSPVAAFVHTVTSGVAVFNNVSTRTDPNPNYFWDFGDGTTSAQQHPTHTYLSSGAYLVKLKITNFDTIFSSVFPCADSIIQSVNVSGIPCLANSNFSMVSTGTAQVWNAVPAYPWNVTAASWNWGDGNVSNTLYTSHQYSAAGMYNICLSVTVSCVASSSTCTSYSVFRTSQAASIFKVNVVAPDLISGLALANADEQLSWNIVPNPNSGEFKLHLNTPKSESMRVVISDITGRIVYKQFIEVDSASVSVYTNNLPSGMYLVTLESENRKVTKRMVVNH
jgi:PKD repeat protein